MDLQAVQTRATEIIRQAGAEVLRYYERPHQIENKSSVFDVVTEADKAVEAVIKTAIYDSFPGHHVVGEESGGTGAPAADAEYFWYIDPIDGTANFSRHLPYFSVSIALADRDLNPLVGLVLDPVSGELFSAVRGQGASRNGQPMRVAGTDTLEQAMLVTGFPYDSESGQRMNVQSFLAFLPQTFGVLRLGSAALDLAYVACGRCDVFWTTHINAWDCMAGILLVREAGGRVTDYSGGETRLDGRELIASNGPLHETVREVILAQG